MKKADQSERRWFQAADRTVKELERKRASADTAYRLTGHPKHERERFLLDTTLDQARQIRRMREKELRRAEVEGSAPTPTEEDHERPE
jgi:hypothetical protein